MDSVDLDLGSVAGLCQIIRALRINLVIHSAAITNVEFCEKNPDIAHKVNVVYSENVAQACAECGVKMVHISTDHIFSGEKSYVSEEEIVVPVNVYGATKAEAELRVTLRNAEALIVRTNFFGWGTSYRKSFSDWIINSLRSQSTTNLFDDVYFTPIYTYDLINAIKNILMLNYSGVINIVSRERISKYDFGIRICNVFHLNQNLIKKDLLINKINLIKRPSDMSLSSKKIEDMGLELIRSIDSQLIALRDHEQMFNLGV